MIAATYGKIIYKYLFSINPRESLEILGQPCIRSHHFKSNWSIQIYLYILKGLDSAWLGLTPSKVPRTNGSPRVAWVGHSCIWGAWHLSFLPSPSLAAGFLSDGGRIGPNWSMWHQRNGRDEYTSYAIMIFTRLWRLSSIPAWYIYIYVI